SEEHTSELQSLAYLVCRLLLEKKKSLVPRSSFAQCCFKVDLNSRTRVTVLPTSRPGDSRSRTEQLSDSSDYTWHACTPWSDDIWVIVGQPSLSNRLKLVLEQTLNHEMEVACPFAGRYVHLCVGV